MRRPPVVSNDLIHLPIKIGSRFWISGGQIDYGAIYFARAIVAVARYTSPQVFNDALAPRYTHLPKV